MTETAWNLDDFNPDTGDGLCFEHGAAACPDTTPPKETHMPRSKAQIAREIQAAHDTIQALNGHIRDLQVELRKAGPEEPKASRLTVSIWFTPRGKRYEYLMMRPPGSSKWFTTGHGSDAVFNTWSDVLAWLNGPDVHNWGHMHTLERGTEL
jgi:hypothetical protein